MNRPNIQETIDHFTSFKQAVHHLMLPELEHYDLSTQQWYMLMLLGKDRRGSTTSDLAETAKITPGAVSQVVDQLSEKGMVERRQGHNDRRVVIITISKAGKDCLKSLRRTQKRMLNTLFGCLTDQELTEFVGLLAKVGHHASNITMIKESR